MVPFTVAVFASVLTVPWAIVTWTTAPASQVPDRSKSVALIKSSPDKVSIVGAAGAEESSERVMVSAALRFPASSVCVTENSLSPSDRSPEVIARLQVVPSTSAATGSAPPMLTDTVAPSSEAPIRSKPRAFSALFTTVPTLGASITGLFGAEKSASRSRVTAPVLTLPAASSVLIERVVSTLATKSPEATETLHLPPESTVAVLVAPFLNPLTVTVDPASPVPVSVKPSSSSKIFTVVPTLGTSTVGSAISTSVLITVAEDKLLLPTSSVWWTLRDVALIAEEVLAAKSPLTTDTLQMP